MKPSTTKTHEEMIREEAAILRHMVLKAARRDRVLKLARWRMGGHLSARSRVIAEAVA